VRDSLCNLESECLLFNRSIAAVCCYPLGAFFLMSSAQLWHYGSVVDVVACSEPRRPTDNEMVNIMEKKHI
jgi:hypothetical protein